LQHNFDCLTLLSNIVTIAKLSRNRNQS
jgi:hypothetical protein